MSHRIVESADGPIDPGSNAEIAAWRKQKRSELLKARSSLPEELHRRNTQLVLDRLIHTASSLDIQIVGFYWPFRREIDVLPFIELALSQGRSAALPVVVARDQPLEFRQWKPGDPMASGVYDIPFPATGRVVQPDTLIVPLVGYDAESYRLGYGGGYYDRTLAAMEKKPITIGVGFSIAKLETIHPQPYDIPMDYIVTEDALIPRHA
jgi:5-formyltetrahydrofolate cyclo-ligase